MRFRVLVLLASVAWALAGCGDGPALDPEAERGRQVYLAHCVACHAADPARPGPVGPAVTGSSRALLEAKIVEGTYPPGYVPKRPTSAMPPMPALAPEIPALAAYLQQASRGAGPQRVEAPAITSAR